MAEFPGIPKDYLTVSFLQQLKEYIDDKAAEGGGGGGGGDCNLFPVTITVDYDNPRPDGHYPFTADKTFAELAEVVDAGKMLLIKEDYGTFLEMNVPSGVCHEPGSDEILFNYARFSVQDSSTWSATLLTLMFKEDGEHHLSITEASISVT